MTHPGEKHRAAFLRPDYEELRRENERLRRNYDDLALSAEGVLGYHGIEGEEGYDDAMRDLRIEVAQYHEEGL